MHYGKVLDRLVAYHGMTYLEIAAATLSNARFVSAWHRGKVKPNRKSQAALRALLRRRRKTIAEARSVENRKLRALPPPACEDEPEFPIFYDELARVTRLLSRGARTAAGSG